MFFVQKRTQNRFSSFYSVEWLSQVPHVYLCSFQRGFASYILQIVSSPAFLCGKKVGVRKKLICFHHHLYGQVFPSCPLPSITKINDFEFEPACRLAPRLGAVVNSLFWMISRHGKRRKKYKSTRTSLSSCNLRVAKLAVSVYASKSLPS